MRSRNRLVRDETVRTRRNRRWTTFLAIHQSPEEIANSLTHGLGLALSLGGSAVLIMAAWRFGSVWHVAGSAVLASTMTAVYAASTLSHLFRGRVLNRLFRILDQAFIYLMIAGTYTPFAFGYLRTGWWWLLFALMWSIAATGFLSKMVWAHRVDCISTWAYLLLGWLPMAAVRPIMEVVPLSAFLWVAAGGACYTIGVVFLKIDRRMPFAHAVWHLLVMAGSGCHYIAVLYHVIPGGS